MRTNYKPKTNRKIVFVIEGMIRTAKESNTFHSETGKVEKISLIKYWLIFVLSWIEAQ